MGQLSHLDGDGHAHMIDVGSKPDTERAAVAEATIRLQPTTAEALFGGELPKGDALAVARIAGIQAAKKTADLIPLCHPLALTSVSVEVSPADEGARVTARVATRGPTGVEMEAMSAVSVAALTLYDMVKGLERGAVIGPVQLLEKSGGSSGEWVR